MIEVFLAHSGGPVVIPDAVAMQSGDTYDNVHFVDSDGRVLVTFQRADLALMTDDPRLAGKMESMSNGH